MASNSLFSSSSPILYWGEFPCVCLCVCVCLCGVCPHIMLCSSGMKLVLETGRSFELEAMGLLITTRS